MDAALRIGKCCAPVARTHGAGLARVDQDFGQAVAAGGLGQQVGGKALRDAGAAILVISEDLDELFQISDRLGALCAGRLSPLRNTTDTLLSDVGGWMAGQFNDAPSSATL